MKTPAELFSLKGKVAVVIGGTGVLCGEMAEGLAIAGATVALVGRDAAKAKARLDKIAKGGGKAEFFPCDTTSKAGLATTAGRCSEEVWPRGHFGERRGRQFADAVLRHSRR